MEKRKLEACATEIPWHERLARAGKALSPRPPRFGTMTDPVQPIAYLHGGFGSGVQYSREMNAFTPERIEQTLSVFRAFLNGERREPLLTVLRQAIEVIGKGK